MRALFETMVRQRIKFLGICVFICLQLIFCSCGQKNKQLPNIESTPQSCDENVVSDDILVNDSGQNNEINSETQIMAKPYIEHIIEYFPDGREMQEKYWDSAGNLAETIDYNYDKELRLLSIVYTDKKGNDTLKNEFEYDEAGNLVLKRTYLWSDISYCQEWFYDENNNCVEYNFWGSSGTLLESCLSYYKDNNLIQEIAYHTYDDTALYAEDDENTYYLSGWEITFYDEKGNVDRIEHYEPNGNYYWEICYPSEDMNITYVETYDLHGNLVHYQESSFDEIGNRLNYLSGASKNSIKIHYEFEYDSNGNKVCTKKFDENGNLDKYTTFEYDLVGNLLIEADYDKYGNLTNKWSWVYDKYGNIISEFYENVSGEITEHTCPEYEYDENGYLIKKIYYSTSE